MFTRTTAWSHMIIFEQTLRFKGQRNVPGVQYLCKVRSQRSDGASDPTSSFLTASPCDQRNDRPAKACAQVNL